MRNSVTVSVFTSCLFALAPANMTWADNGDMKSIAKHQFSDEELRIATRLDRDAEAFLTKMEFYDITYESDGHIVEGYLLIPNEAANVPCVIYNRGGNNHPDYQRGAGAPPAQFALARYGRIASWGYVVVASQYRGKGVATAADNLDEFGGADVNDVVYLVDLLENLTSGDYRSTVSDGDSLPDLETSLNPNRVGMYGWSRGGMMTMRALQQLKAAGDSRISAAIIGGGAFDLFDSPRLTNLYRDCMGAEFTENKFAALSRRSAPFWVDELPQIPFLLLHGTDDTAVHSRESVRMMRMMRSVFTRTPGHLVMFEGGSHGLRNVLHRDSVDLLAERWLCRFVKVRDCLGTAEEEGQEESDGSRRGDRKE